MRILATAAVLALAPAAAFANCAGVQPVQVNQVRIDPLDAQGPAEVLQPFTLSFNRASADDAPVMIEYQIMDEDSPVRARVGDFKGPTVDFAARDTGKNVAVFRSDAFSPLQAGRVVIPAGRQSASTEVFLRVTDLRADLAAGVYRESFTVRFRCSPDQAMADEANGAVNVAVAVPNVLSANVAGASTRGEIDFLDFAMLERSLAVNVRSTGPYRISARSLNGGEMRREGAAVLQPSDRIAYEARLDGKVLKPDSTALRMERAGLLGHRFSLDVEVESVESKRAGLYADTLLLTLTPVN